MTEGDVGHCEIVVLAGPNGAGKSTVAGEALRGRGSEYFNPDEYARRLRHEFPDLTEGEANSRAWEKSRDLLVRAIEENSPYAFETTLGGTTIPNLLRQAALRGRVVRIWYVALSTADLHVERVAQRVERGGHPISEADIRRRYDSSRVNITDLLPLVHEVRVYDNSADSGSEPPGPISVIHVVGGAIVDVLPLAKVPDWAKSIVAAAAALPDSGMVQEPERASGES